MNAPLLELHDVSTYYGSALALDGLSFSVQPGECVAVLGPNGAGKTTTAQSIMGFTPPRTGRVLFDGTDIAGWLPQQIVRRGIALVPQGRRIFGSLTTEENLWVSVASRRDNPWPLERVYQLFPRLLERRRQRGDTLSGGEQQMLAIGRALLTAPSLLILDEPTEGLAPVVIDDIAAALAELKSEGVALLLSEQRTEFALGVADSVVAMVSGGRITFRGSASAYRPGEADVGQRTADVGATSAPAALQGTSADQTKE